MINLGLRMKLNAPDPIVEKVRQKLLDRSQVGMAKYGCTMARDDLTILDFLKHHQEELMDAAIYVERLIQDHLLRIETSERGQ
jgi:hypothetical protein